MTTATRFLAVAAAAAMLGGCQTFPLTSWMFRNGGPALEQRLQPASEAGLALEEGKAYLRKGKLAAAVVSFRIARGERSTRAEASNGLAVAFAALGRLDLAERYFQEALSAEPDNQKYLANFSRLQQQVLLANRREAPRVAFATQPTLRHALAGRGRTTGPVERVSRTEVLVHSTPDRAAPPVMVVASREAEPANDPAGSSPGEENIGQAGAALDSPLTVAFVN